MISASKLTTAATALILVLLGAICWIEFRFREISREHFETSKWTSRVDERVSTQQDNKEYLWKQFHELKDSVILMPERMMQAPAILSPKSDGYTVVHTDHGPFTIAVKHSEAFMDGHKVTFKIGNLSAASMNGIVLNITYGPADPAFSDSKLTLDDYLKICAANEAAKRTIDLETKKNLLPGSFTDIETVLSPSKPEDLGYIEVRLKVTAVALK